MAALTRAWLLLMALTVAAVWTGSVPPLPSSGSIQGALVIGVAGLKGWIILDRYMGLGRSARGWRIIFAVLLGLLSGGIVAVGFGADNIQRYPTSVEQRVVS